MYSVEFISNNNEVLEAYVRNNEYAANRFCEKLNKALLFDNVGHWVVRPIQ